MATILEIAQRVARAVGFNVPSALVASTEETDQRLLEAVRSGGVWLSREYPWSALVAEHTFATVSSIESYTLPSDFDRLYSETAWNRDQYWQLRGSRSAGQWQRDKGELASSPFNIQTFRINAGPRSRTLRIFPTPTAAEDLALEYVTSHWLLDTDGTTTKADIAADTDLPRLDEELLQEVATWRFMRAIGMQYADEKADAERHCHERYGDDAPAEAVILARDPALYQGLMPANFPRRGFG